MTATSAYLNKPLRTTDGVLISQVIEQAMRDSALNSYYSRDHAPGETFVGSQEFRDYRYNYRLAVNGSNGH